MIFYIAHQDHAYTQAVVLLYHRTDLEASLRLVRYEDAALLREVRSGVVIWTDMDRLTTDALRDAASLSDELALKTGLTQLNHPTRSLQRFDLLRMLQTDGSNPFGVFRPHQLENTIRYPVFIRDEVGALYREPPLLHDRSTLDAEIARLGAGDLARPMVVEMIGTPWADGYYRKFAAFRVGDTVYGQHCAMSKSWFVKNSPAQLLLHHVDEIRAYISKNPDAEAVMGVFDKARMQYGRIDYTFVDGRLVVFEINSNPTILSDPPTPFASYDPRPFADLHADALLRLPKATEPGSLPAIDKLHRAALSALRRRYQIRRLKLMWRNILGKKKRRSDPLQRAGN